MTTPPNGGALELVKILAERYNREVSLTYVCSHGAWRAGCVGIIKQSLVGPEDALVQLSSELAASGISGRKTDRFPVVVGVRR